MTGTKQSRPYQCSVCTAKFRLIFDLEQHTAVGCDASRSAKRVRIYKPRIGPRAMQACLACATSKTKCDNESQCKRCRRRNTPCVRPTATGKPEDPESSYLSLSPSDVTGDSMSLNNLDDADPLGNLADDQNQHHLHLNILDQMPMGDETELDGPQPAPPALVENLTKAQDNFQRGNSHQDWNLNILEEYFNFDTQFDITDDLDFLFPLPEVLSNEIGQVAYAQASISPVIAEEKSEQVRDAFNMATGRWVAAAGNFQDDEERNLSATEGAHIMADSEGLSETQLLPNGFPLAVRDRLLTMLVSASDSRDQPRVPAAFPCCDALGFLFKSFLLWHSRQEDTWIHIPTFNLNGARIELVAGMIAGGALRSQSPAVQRFGLAINELLSVQLWKMGRMSNILTRDLQYLQAFALQLHNGLWSGDKRKMEMAGSQLGNITNILRGGGHYRKSSYLSISPLPEDHGSVLEEKWRKWVEQESLTRLVYHMNFHSSQESFMTSVPGPLHYTELSLRFPKARSLWFSKSAESWKATFASDFTDDSSQPSLVDCLMDVSRLQNVPSLYDANIARLSVLQGISTLIRNYQRSQMMERPNEGIAARETVMVQDSKHCWLLRALEGLNQLFKLIRPDFEPSITVLVTLELLSLHFCISTDQLELLAGKEGLEEAKVAYATLRPWVESKEARQAVWHAGQVLKLIRELPLESMTDFHCVAVYHVSLCFWAWGTIRQKRQSEDTASSGEVDPSLPTGEDVLLGDEESLNTQRWIAHGYGRPLFASGGSGADAPQPPVSLDSTGTLIQECIKTVRYKYVSQQVLPPAMENLCNLMQALGATVVVQEDKI